MKEVKIAGTYKCGHSWTTILPNGGSKHEIRAVQNSYKYSVCPKCETKNQKAGA